MAVVPAPLSMAAGASMSGTARRTVVASGHLAGTGGEAASSSAALFSAAAVLTCSYLSARIVMATNIMFPANQLGTYGATEAETTVTVPGITDGIYT